MFRMVKSRFVLNLLPSQGMTLFLRPGMPAASAHISPVCLVQKGRWAVNSEIFLGPPELLTH
jgi:hypothetical protein